MEFLTTRNGLKRIAMHAVAREAHRLRLVEQENQAGFIAQSVAKAIAGGR